jgi:hypothetical protein
LKRVILVPQSAAYFAHVMETCGDLDSKLHTYFMPAVIVSELSVSRSGSIILEERTPDSPMWKKPFEFLFVSC